MTPNELAAELGISPKTLRAWLRDTFPRPEVEKHTPWFLGATIIERARVRFA